jgi:hypothetical protein
MLNNFQLVAITKSGNEVALFRVPIKQPLQASLAKTWSEQLQNFIGNVDEVDFDAGYNPETEERFKIKDFQLPQWLAQKNSQTVTQLPPINNDSLIEIRAIAAFARDRQGHEVILFQSFSRSHVIQPGRYLLLQDGVYDTNTDQALTLGNQLSAVYSYNNRKLVFHHFRSVNVYLPLADYYKEAAAEDIREILSHEAFAAENVDVLAKGASQWFRKRFSILRDSKILEDYTVQHIATHAQGYDVELQINDNKIVFPADKTKAKKLLQYLNEELYKGAITEKLYETNSKKEAE